MSHARGIDGESTVKPVGARAPWTAEAAAPGPGTRSVGTGQHTALGVFLTLERVLAGSSPLKGSTCPTAWLWASFLPPSGAAAAHTLLAHETASPEEAGFHGNRTRPHGPSEQSREQD